MSQPPATTHDRAKVLRFVRLLKLPVELRVPNAGKEGTISGYFDDADKLADAITRHSGRVPGVYVTLNPVDRALLCRAYNRVVAYARDTTKDADIARRWWLPIDVDPVRPSGISSSEAEHDDALKTALAIRDRLAAKGFPPGILADSGNGGHLLYRIDMPNDGDARDLIAAFLKTLAARFDTATVRVDQKVFNAARIWKCYGSMARKGDPVGDRRHRIARMVDVPDDLSPVPPEVIRAVAGAALKASGDNPSGLLPGLPSVARGAAPSVDSAADIEAFCAAHNLTITESGPYKGGMRYVLNACPFSAAHSSGDARGSALFVSASGGRGFKCHHTTCADKKWGDVLRHYGVGERSAREGRDLADPGRSGAGEAAATPRPWGNPADLTAVAGGTAPFFPADHLALVPELHDLCRAVAVGVQIAVDVPALMGLAVLSAACSDRVAVAVRPGSYLPAVLWTLAALEPGERKTAAVEPVIRPIKDWEERQRVETSADVQARRAQRQVARQRLKVIEARLAKADGAAVADLTAEYERCLATLEGPDPEAPRVLVDDATSEALVPVLQKHGGRAACLSDEATFLEVALGRYSNDPKLEMYMKGHDGGDYRCDRAGREPVYLPRLYLTFGFCIQVDALRRYAGNEVAQGRGFFPRFLTAVPNSLIGRREFRATPPGDLEHARRRWGTLVERLLDGRTRRYLDHTPEGYEVIRQFELRYEPLMGANGPLAPVRQWVAKAVSGQMLRVAALLHVGSGDPADTVSVAALRAAVGIVEYFLAHTRAIHRAGGDDRALTLARKIRDTILTKGWRRVTVAQFKRFAYVGKDVTDEVIREAYRLLVAANVLQPERTTGRTTYYAVNPALVG